MQLPRNREELYEVYVVMGQMDTDLTSINSALQKPSDEHCRILLYQILRGLNYMHSKRFYMVI